MSCGCERECECVCVCVTAAGGRAEVLHILIGVKGLWAGINVASFEFTGFWNPGSSYIDS